MERIMRLKSAYISHKCNDRVPSDMVERDGVRVDKIDNSPRKKAFFFRQRLGMLDVRSIKQLDIDRVVEEVDIGALQAQLENIAFANVAEAGVRTKSDTGFLNLFRLSQLLLEYLLNIQDKLATDLEVTASNLAAIRERVHDGKANLHQTCGKARALKREVRQNWATIARYEELLDILRTPRTPAGLQDRAMDMFGAPRSDGLYRCPPCGKEFVSVDFLRQHMLREHPRRDMYQSENQSESGSRGRIQSEGESRSRDGEKVVDQATGRQGAATPQPLQLKLFIMTSSGRCLEMHVGNRTTVSRLRSFINSVAGYAAAGPDKRLVHRGVDLGEDQTLAECNVTSGSQLLVLDAQQPSSPEKDACDAPPLAAKKRRPRSKAGAEMAAETATEIEGEAETAAKVVAANKESWSSTQMSTLLALLKHQTEWTMRVEEGRREQDMTATEALEMRMREIEASLPRRLEELLEENIGSIQSSLHKMLDDMGEFHKKSKAGALIDDVEETTHSETELLLSNAEVVKQQAEQAEQADKKFVLLSAEVERISQQNSELVAELSKMKEPSYSRTSEALALKPSSAAALSAQMTSIRKSRTSGNRDREQDEVREPAMLATGEEHEPGTDVNNNERRLRSSCSSVSSFPWDLSFPSHGDRPPLIVQVPYNGTCATACEAIAGRLNVPAARVLLREGRSGATVSPWTSSADLRDLFEEKGLELELLGGTVVSDNVVDGLVEFYEHCLPIEARDNTALSNRFAEIEVATARHGKSVPRQAKTDGDITPSEITETQVTE